MNCVDTFIQSLEQNPEIEELYGDIDPLKLNNPEVIENFKSLYTQLNLDEKSGLITLLINENPDIFTYQNFLDFLDNVFGIKYDLFLNTYLPSEFHGLLFSYYFIKANTAPNRIILEDSEKKYYFELSIRSLDYLEIKPLFTAGIFSNSMHIDTIKTLVIHNYRDKNFKDIYPSNYERTDIENIIIKYAPNLTVIGSINDTTKHIRIEKLDSKYIYILKNVFDPARTDLTIELPKGTDIQIIDNDPEFIKYLKSIIRFI